LKEIDVIVQKNTRNSDMKNDLWILISALALLCLGPGCLSKEDDLVLSESHLNDQSQIATATLWEENPTKNGTIPSEVLEVHVPQGKPQLIDGTISPGEWDGAAIETFSDGSELLMMYSEGYLYLGLRANTAEMIVGNVHLNYEDEITILHASAALGSGIYQKESGYWHLVRGFSWCCRNSTSSESAQAELDTLLENDHWVATNSRIGKPNEIEYQIEVSHKTLQIAVNYIRASKPNIKILWPNNLDDDCKKPTPGGLPEKMYFSPNKWGTIVIHAAEAQ
jgi:hypothetical protein